MSDDTQNLRMQVLVKKDRGMLQLFLNMAGEELPIASAICPTDPKHEEQVCLALQGVATAICKAMVEEALDCEVSETHSTLSVHQSG